MSKKNQRLLKKNYFANKIWNFTRRIKRKRLFLKFLLYFTLKSVNGTYKGRQRIDSTFGVTNAPPVKWLAPISYLTNVIDYYISVLQSLLVTPSSDQFNRLSSNQKPVVGAP